MTNEVDNVLAAVSEPNPPRLTTQQIGRLGELLVQFELLRYGIDSAPMTTDAGVDLVAYAGSKGRSLTIQVKTNLTPKPGGGKGASAVESESLAYARHGDARFSEFLRPRNRAMHCQSSAYEGKS